MKNRIGLKNQIKIGVTAAIAVLAAFIMALSMLAFPVARADSQNVAVLKYADESQTIVTGIDKTAQGFDANSPYEVKIPDTVKEIGLAAFSGETNLTSLTFDPNVSLEKIGDFAFGGTGLTVVELPTDLKEIGAAAFADNSLTLVTLPDSLEIVGKRAFGNNKTAAAINLPDNDKTVYGEDAFDSESYLIAKNKTSREMLANIESLSAYVDDLTYIVTIEYNYLGTVIDTEQRLFGRGYDVALVDGVWKESPSNVGTDVTGNMTWYNAANSVMSKEEVSKLINDKDGEDVITLYSYAKADGSKKLFIVRKDIAYDGKEYAAGTGLNALLLDVSDKITPSMNVSIKSYTDVEGNVKSATSIKDAGVYSIQIQDGETYNIEINVARKIVNLGDYQSGLSWKLLSYMSGQQITSELLSANGTVLYLYNRIPYVPGEDGEGEEETVALDDELSVYPSTKILSDNEIDARGLYSEYTTVFVKYSIARFSGEDVKLAIFVDGNEAYTVGSYVGEHENIAEVGKYTAGVTLTATDNYLLGVDGNSVDMEERGMKITVSKDGKTATIYKDWYVVDVANQAMSENSADYKIVDRMYGENLAVEVPYLMYGDVGPEDFGTALDPVKLTLMYNGEAVTAEGGSSTFTRDEFMQYINASMPAGEYSLIISARAVTSEEYADDDTEKLNPIMVYHSGFEQTVTFTVTEKGMLTVITDKINSALRKRTFTYVWDGEAHYYTESVAETIASALSSATATIERSGVWENETYDGLFGEFDIVFNLARMQNDIYYSADAMPIKPTDPDKYILFYKVVAPNYADSVELIGGASRTDYYFEVVNVREIEIPSAYAKTYTGSLLVSDLADTLIYTVDKNDGGISVGEYDVVLSFREPDYYMWQGQTVDNKTASVTVKFSVTPATNRWDVEPGVAFWVQGSYDKTENAVIGTARFGTAVIVITDANDKEVYNSLTGVNKLSSLKAGIYRLSATVSGSNDYDALTYSAFVQVFKKQTLPWWGIAAIVAGALLIAAIVILILWKKGVFQILTSKLMLAIRTKATVDATIAAVRANRVAQASQASIAEANARDAAEERAKARAAAAEAERNKTAEEKAAELEAKAQAESERAERIKARADSMLAKASVMKGNMATEEPVAEEPETEVATEAEPETEVATEAEPETAATEAPAEKEPVVTPVQPKKKSSTKKKSDGPKNI